MRIGTVPGTIFIPGVRRLPGFSGIGRAVAADVFFTGSTERFAQLKRRVFEDIAPFIPVTIAEDESRRISQKEIHQRRAQHFEAWLAQFQPKDRRLALLFLSKLTYVDEPRLRAHSQTLHRQLMTQLKQDGFMSENPLENPYQNIDFTTIYDASSGQRFSYSYRKANKIPKVQFNNQATLAHNGEDKSNRALVILDDYIGTGAQLLCEALAHGPNLAHHQNKHLQDLARQYRAVYFGVAVANQKAIERFSLLQQGDIEGLVASVLDKYPELNNPEYCAIAREALGALSGGKLKLIPALTEWPLLEGSHPNVSAEESQKLQAFLLRNNVYKYPFGVGGFVGNTVFDYSVPSNVPDMLWNSKARQLGTDGKPDPTRSWLSLFHRVEDTSAYHFVDKAAKDGNPIPLKGQVY